MKFEVSRSSVLSFIEKEKPCENAQIYSYPHTCASTTYDPRTGKRIIQEKREVPKYCWSVEINTLEELKDLCKEVNVSLIFSNDTDIPGLDGSIEIYDDYRE